MCTQQETNTRQGKMATRKVRSGWGVGVVSSVVMYASIIEVQNCQIKDIHSSVVSCSGQEKGEIGCLGFEFILVV